MERHGADARRSCSWTSITILPDYFSEGGKTEASMGIKPSNFAMAMRELFRKCLRWSPHSSKLVEMMVRINGPLVFVVAENFGIRGPEMRPPRSTWGDKMEEKLGVEVHWRPAH